MPRVVALMDDLFFQMKVFETAKHVGVEFKVATSTDALLGLLDPLPQLVIVDLNSRSQPIQTIEKEIAERGGTIQRQYGKSHGTGLGDALIAATAEMLGLARFDMKYSAGALAHGKMMRGIELYGRKVIPMVREMLATRGSAAAG